MQELSMNILDVAQNSVRAGASLICIGLTADAKADTLLLTIEDNGCGMDEETAARALDPFYTTRTTRKIGLGLPFLKMAAEQTGGNLHLDSNPGKGTTVRALFGLSHIDLMPLGDMGGTMSALVQASPDIDFVFCYTRDKSDFTFDTREVREILGDVPLSDAAVAVFLRSYVAEHIEAVDSGLTDNQKGRSTE